MKPPTKPNIIKRDPTHPKATALTKIKTHQNHNSPKARTDRKSKQTENQNRR
jgi:hypothetical protein